MPRFENKATLAKEAAFIARVAPKWQCKAHKNPLWYRVDFSLERNDSIVAFAEAKCRNIEHNKDSTFFISLEKYLGLHYFHKLTGMPAFILVEWTDISGYVQVPCDYQYIRWDGRKDRKLSDDEEPMVHIPISMFRKLEDGQLPTGDSSNFLESPETSQPEEAHEDGLEGVDLEWDDDF